MSNTAERNVRVQILVPPKSAERLDRLVTETESSSAAEVVRNALRLYEAVIDAEKHDRPFFQRIDGQMVPVLMMGPYAPPVRKSMVLPIGTRDDFQAADRKTLQEGLGYLVVDPPAIRHFAEGGSGEWVENVLVPDPKLDVSTFEEGEIRSDVDTFLVRMNGQGWRAQPDPKGPPIDSLLKRSAAFLRKMAG